MLNSQSSRVVTVPAEKAFDYYDVSEFREEVILQEAHSQSHFFNLSEVVTILALTVCERVFAFRWRFSCVIDLHNFP